MNFGEYFAQLRRKRKMTLRAFCLKNGFDPSNISKLERGLFKAPQEDYNLRKYAKALGIKDGSDDWMTFFDLAAASNKTFEVKNISDEALLEKLPVLFRAIDREDLREEELDELISLIKQA